MKVGYVFTIQRATHTIKGDNSKCIFFISELSPFFDYDLLFSIKHPTAERWHWHAVLLLITQYYTLLVFQHSAIGTSSRLLLSGNKEYRLRGYKENVHKANEEILQVLLNDKPGDPTVERKRRRAAQPRRTLEFTKVMAVDEPEMPSYWKNFRPGETLNNLLVEMKHFLINRKYEKVQLKEDAPTYKAILRFINKTFEEGKGNIGQGKDASGIRQYSQCFVVKICRIENPELYALYAHKRTEIFRKLFTKQLGFFPRLENVMTGQHQRNLQPIQTVCLNQDRELTKDVYDEVNEYYFFHGTKPESIDKICSDGLDSRLCSPDAMFGQGIYGAESVVKADQYTGKPRDGFAENSLFWFL